MKLKLFLISIPFVIAGCTQSEEVKEKPNILFCIMDDASVHMGAYGCDWCKTPSFDKLAKQGILFTNAYTPNAKCAPSRPCVLTGRNSWQLEEAANHVVNFPAKFKTFPEVLRENGYVTAKTGKGWGPGDPGRIASTWSTPSISSLITDAIGSGASSGISMAIPGSSPLICLA